MVQISARTSEILTEVYFLGHTSWLLLYSCQNTCDLELTINIIVVDISIPKFEFSGHVLCNVTMILSCDSIAASSYGA